MADIMLGARDIKINNRKPLSLKYTLFNKKDRNLYSSLTCNLI